MGELEHINALRNAYERYKTATIALDEDFFPFDLVQKSAFEKSKRDGDAILAEVEELRKAIIAGAMKAKHLSAFLRSRMREGGVIEQSTILESIVQQVKGMKKNENIVLALEAQPRKDNVAASLDGSSRQNTNPAVSNVVDDARDGGVAHAAEVCDMPPPKVMVKHETAIPQMVSDRRPGSK